MSAILWVYVVVQICHNLCENKGVEMLGKVGKKIFLVC